MQERASLRKTILRGGAAVTAAAALFFPKIEGIKNDDAPFWELALFFVPSVVAAMLVTFPGAGVAVLVALTGLSAIAVIDFLARGLGLLTGMLRGPQAAEA